MKEFSIVGDTVQKISSVLLPSDYVSSRLLAADIAENITVPSGARIVVFTATADFYAKFNGTASVPGDVADGTASELNPVARYIDDVSIISVVSAGVAIVIAAFYK